MTSERINEISQYLAKDLEGTKALLDMDASDAAAKLSAGGFAVTAEELIGYGEEIKKIAGADENGELGENDLVNVAGGVATATLIIVGLVAGYAMAKGKW